MSEKRIKRTEVDLFLTAGTLGHADVTTQRCVVYVITRVELQ